MRFDETLLQKQLEEDFGIPLKIASSDRSAAVDRLSLRERARYEALKESPRCESWLKGRAALKRLLSDFVRGEDTSEVAFPNPRFSLTHSGAFAVAVGTDSEGLNGIGVDFEIDRRPHPESGRFFLTEEECDWMRRQKASDRPARLIRLWTVKEALFKADPNNAGALLSDYRIENPAAWRGRAFINHGRTIEILYSSFHCEGGWISMAVYPRRNFNA